MKAAWAIRDAVTFWLTELAETEFSPIDALCYVVGGVLGALSGLGLGIVLGMLLV